MKDTLLKRARQGQLIKSKLALAGYTMSDIDRQYELTPGATRRCVIEPNEAAEKAIADALGEPAHELWPERYDQKTGERLSPQPFANYERVPPIRQRRKGDVDSTAGALT
ncbi:MAG: helix-turn-helix domain-containing protein [Nitratireductor sp.]|nr:helix-turn-helix domain-containing protein [Nitratireductor sp.]